MDATTYGGTPAALRLAELAVEYGVTAKVGRCLGAVRTEIAEAVRHIPPGRFRREVIKALRMRRMATVDALISKHMPDVPFRYMRNVIQTAYRVALTEGR